MVLRGAVGECILRWQLPDAPPLKADRPKPAPSLPVRNAPNVRRSVKLREIPEAVLRPGKSRQGGFRILRALQRRSNCILKS